MGGEGRKGGMPVVAMISLSYPVTGSEAIGSKKNGGNKLKSGWEKSPGIMAYRAPRSQT